MALNSLTSILIGYLLGSVSPAYFLTKWIKGVDIREIGARYAGTTNVKRNVGLFPAIVTGFYDILKGSLAIFIALRILHTSEGIAYLGGVSAILGHIYPFYIGFRGGKGVAVATGMLIYSLGKVTISFLPSRLILLDLLYLAFVVLAIYLATFDENFLVSIVINASTMILAPFLIPGLMKVLTGSYVHINVMKMFEDLTITLLFPVAAGIASRWIVEHTILKSDEKIRHFLSKSCLTMAQT